MKKHFFKPGFEFIFTLSLLVVLGLPPLVFGQTHKDLTINIDNGDTTVNGKNIKELSANDKEAALKDINQIGKSEAKTTDRKFVRTVLITNDNSPDSSGDKRTRKIVIAGDGDGLMIADGDARQIKVRMKAQDGKDSTFTYSYHLNKDDREAGPMVTGEHREMSFIRRDDDRRLEFKRRNSQTFNYSTTDNDGVSTNVNFRVSDASPEKVKGIAGVDDADLVIKDINLNPQFSAGKTVLMFSLPSKEVAEVQFKDSEGNVLWRAKAVNGDFSKSFSLGLNGIYYLQVKQGDKIAVRKIFKEQM